MNKKLKNILLVVVFFLYFGMRSAFAGDISLVLNDEPLTLKMFNENGRVLVPVRKLSNDMGYKVLWDNTTRKVLIKKDFKNVTFTIDEKDIVVNNEKVHIDVAPRIVDNITYVPVRAFCEAFNNDIEYSNNRINIKSNTNGNKNMVVFLEKQEEREFNGKKVICCVCIPQILNYNNEVSVDRINSYYKKEGCYHIANFRSNKDNDSGIKCEGLTYNLHHNNGNVISFVCLHYIDVGGPVIPPVNTSYSGDVFNVKTGEKLRIQDILKGTEEEIEQFLISKLGKVDECNKTYYGNLSAKNIEDCVKEDRYYFYIDNGRLILGAYFGETGIDIRKNKEVFNERFLDAMFGKDTDEEYRVIESAHKYFNKDAKIIDKTTLGQDECYVFDGKNEIVAIDRSNEKVYVVEKVDNVYKILETKKVNNGIGNLTALKLVMDEINFKEYSYELGGILRENDEEYIIVTIRDLEEKVESNLAVDKKTGEILAYYFE